MLMIHVMSQNLLVFHHGPQWHVKIVDFGLSKRIVADATSFRTQAGTMGFMAPEVLGLGPDEDDSSDEESQSYTNAVDIWAVQFALAKASMFLKHLLTHLPFSL
jgi:serine/threonine protein kinase